MYDFNNIPEEKGVEKPVKKFGVKCFEISCVSCDNVDTIPQSGFTELRENLGWSIEKGKWMCTNCANKS